jgi:hypothetical protein
VIKQEKKKKKNVCADQETWEGVRVIKETKGALESDVTC